MKFHLRQTLFLLKIVLLVTLSACSQLQDSSPLPPQTQDSDPVEVVVTEELDEGLELPTMTAAPDEAPAQEGTPQEEPRQEEFINLDELEIFELPNTFDTYQVNIQYNLGDLDTEITADVNNLTASSMTVQENNPSDPELAQTTYQNRTLNGFATLIVDGSCSVNNYNAWGFKIDEDLHINPFDHFLPSDFLIGNAVLTGNDVEVNGRSTNQFTLTIDNFARGEDPPFHLNELELGEFFIDVETGTLVQLMIEGSGSISMFGSKSSGPIYYELNNQNFDQPLNIDFLPECGPEPNTQFPILEPMMMYQNDPERGFFEATIPFNLEEVAEFYRSSLKADNWTLTEEESYGGTDLYLQFLNGSGETLNVNLMGVNTSGETSITTVTLSLFSW